MNFGQIARLLAGFMLFFSLFLMVPLGVSLYEKTEYETSLAFAIALATGLGMAGLLWLAGMQSSKEMFRREGLVVIVLAWVIAAALSAIPFKWSGAIPNPVDAFFESMSGITTTGATVLGTNNFTIEELPESILLWRAMLQWIGGIGIVLVFIVLLPAMGVTGSRLLSSEQVGMSDQSNRPRMSSQARKLLLIYTSLTIVAGIAYWIAGLPTFDALCHAMTTLATAGFSNNNQSIGGYDNLGVEIVAIVFMFIAGCNFLYLARALIRGGSSDTTILLKKIEFRVFLGLVVGIALTMSVILWAWGGQFNDKATGVIHDYRDFGRCLRDATFQTVSILTTTGYSSTNFNCWPKVALYLLVLCMFIGGCTGSTSGGIKVLRVVICAKLLGYAQRRFVRPRSVETLKVGSTPVPAGVITTLSSLLLLWIGFVIAGTLVLALEPKLDLASAFITSLCMMSCVGPSISETIGANDGSLQLVGEIDLGPYGGYGQLHPRTKLFMSLQMLLGRLEILAPLALLTPGFWRR